MSEDLIVRAENPAEQAKLLQDQAAPLQASESNVSYSVNLGVHEGDFILNWSVTPQVYGRWDWVGVFENAENAQNDPSGTYKYGGWQWADAGSPYSTSITANDGCVIAYIVWNYGTKSYQAVAISAPY